MKPKLVSTLLPKAVRDALIAAAQVDSKAEAGGSVPRTRALDAAITQARRHHPAHFKDEGRDLQPQDDTKGT